ncbi:hypothetical protein ACQP1K_17450 [Sphaerimonospora sp. CA-214678]
MARDTTRQPVDYLRTFTLPQRGTYVSRSDKWPERPADPSEVSTST